MMSSSFKKNSSSRPTSNVWKTVLSNTVLFNLLAPARYVSLCRGTCLATSVDQIIFFKEKNVKFVSYPPDRIRSYK